MKRSFDSIAHPYQKLEYFFFGDLLERVRAHHLPSISPQSQTALLIGDGDGRFAESLLQTLPHLQIDSIDSSSTMLEIARKRLDNPPSFQPIFANALTHSYPDSQYDLIALNFVVDCFTQEQFDFLKPKLQATLKPNGQLLYSDFAYTQSRFRNLLIQTLYLLFFGATALETRALPQTRWRSDFTVQAAKTWLNGALTSQLLKNKSGANDRRRENIAILLRAD
ncbi:MAG: class I SAM-dependent methyltransferase [Verrucomicrobiota bacterium]